MKVKSNQEIVISIVWLIIISIIYGLYLYQSGLNLIDVISKILFGYAIIFSAAILGIGIYGIVRILITYFRKK